MGERSVVTSYENIFFTAAAIDDRLRHLIDRISNRLSISKIWKSRSKRLLLLIRARHTSLSMKNTNLLIVLGSIALLIMPTNSPVAASPINPIKKVSFYCRSNNKGQIVTTMAVENRPSTQDLVVWKNDFRKMTPRKRCDEAAQRFQSLWNRRTKFFLVSGMDSNNSDGLICGTISDTQNCTPGENLLFRVKTKDNAEDIVKNLWEEIRYKYVNPPVQAQRISAEGIDMNALVDLMLESPDIKSLE